MKTLDECKAAAGGKPIWTAKVGPVEFHYRRPTTREWLPFEAASLALEALDRKDQAAFQELQRAAEDLAVAVCESHTPEEMQTLHEELFGIFFPIAMRVAETVNEIRAAAGKAQSAPGLG